MAALLEIRDLRTHLYLRRGTVRAVDGASLSVQPGEALALVGESGSGKSMLCHSVLRLEPRPAAAIVSGQILFDGMDLAQLAPERMREVRGRRIGMVLQDPLGSLNPVMTIGDQVVEALRLSQPSASRAELRDRASAALERVGIRDGRKRLNAYPFEFSGGMRQRVVAAIAVVRQPALLIADEPTTALDVTTQAHFLELLRELRAENGMGLILVTHDLGIVNRSCDRVAVMYAGRIVETGRTRDLLASARHPYTRALLRALPHLDGPRLRRMAPIAGEPPGAAALTQGCRFAPRCAHAMPQCEHEHPPQLRYDNGDEVSCWLHVPGAAAARVAAAVPTVAPNYDAARAGMSAPPPQPVPLLELRDLGRSFRAKRAGSGAGSSVVAVADVCLAVAAGESVGIAGESGSGKTTLVWMILQLLAPTSGHILFEGQAVDMASRQRLADYRRSVQAVLQDSSAALNARMRIRDLVAEPLVVQQPDTAARDIDDRVDELLRSVGLPAGIKSCYPHELSGGQKQRVAIARSLIVDPRLLVLDEPVSALDVSVRSQVLNLLLDLKEARQLTYLIVAHDLAVLRHVTDTLVVMYRGRVVEQGPTERVLAAPAHPYTRALVAASPRLDGVGPVVIKEVETSAALDAGCAFAPRCPQVAAVCLASRPLLLRLDTAGDERSAHRAACHFGGQAPAADSAPS